MTVLACNDAPEINLNGPTANGQYRDEFSSVAYSNTNGTTNWSSDAVDRVERRRQRQPAARSASQSSECASAKLATVADHPAHGQSGRRDHRDAVVQFLVGRTESGEDLVITFAADG